MPLRRLNSLNPRRRKTASLPVLPSALTEVAEVEGDGSEYFPCQGTAVSSRGIDEGGEEGRETEGEVEEPAARAGKRCAGQRASGRAAGAAKLSTKNGRSSGDSKRAPPVECLSARKRPRYWELSPEPCAGVSTTEDESFNSGGTNLGLQKHPPSRLPPASFPHMSG